MKTAVSILAASCKGLVAFAIVAGTAAGARAQEDNTVHYTVRLDDLDLATERGQLDAHRRIAVAAHRVCVEITSAFESLSARSRCAEEIADAATPQLAQRIAQARVRTQPGADALRMAQTTLPATPGIELAGR